MTRKIDYNLIRTPNTGTSKITSNSSTTVFDGAADERNYLIYGDSAEEKAAALSAPLRSTRTSAGLLDELRLSGNL